MRTIFSKYFSGLTRNSFLLACASLFSDISTEMLYPVLPVYLTQNLKASGSIIGVIEGIAQATQNIVQGLSGYLSDLLQRRKPIALLGYALSAISKPFIGIATAWQGVLGARFSDRFGTGTRSAPRDALVAASASEEDRGKAFGLEGIGDNLGAFIGPLITILVFVTLRFDIHYVFYLAVIPGILAFLMVLFVKENKSAAFNAKSKLELHHFPKEYWKYLAVTAVFGIGNSSTSFLILQIKEKGLSLTETVFVYALFNLAAALISYPAGFLSDKFGRKPVLAIGFLIFIISYTGFAYDPGVTLSAALLVFFGLFQGIFRSAGKTFAADFVPQHLRASGIGWYSTVVGLSSLVASIAAGQLWDKVSHISVFIYAASLSLVGTLLLFFFIPNRSPLKNI